MIWNPIPHMQHAWSGTNTVWGKLGLVLFYSLIWIGIISAIWSVIDPQSQGTSCFTAPLEKDAKDLVLVLIRGLNIFIVGFLLYADVGGLKTKNVAMVTVIFAWYLLTVLFASSSLFKSEQYKDCMKGLNVQVWIGIAWPALALIFVIMDDKLGGGGASAEEQQPLSA